MCLDCKERSLWGLLGSLSHRKPFLLARKLKRCPKVPEVYFRSGVTAHSYFSMLLCSLYQLQLCLRKTDQLERNMYRFACIVEEPIFNGTRIHLTLQRASFLLISGTRIHFASLSNPHSKFSILYNPGSLSTSIP